MYFYFFSQPPSTKPMENVFYKELIIYRNIEGFAFEDYWLYFHIKWGKVSSKPELSLSESPCPNVCVLILDAVVE